MPVAITIRNVPEETRDELAARAARAGQSLQEYLRNELVAAAARPSAADWVARVRHRAAATGVAVTPEAILEAREADRR